MDQPIAQTVRAKGWVHLARHVPEEVCAHVRKPEALEWRRLAPKVGVVTQSGWFAQITFDEAPGTVEALGRKIYDLVREEAGARFPLFNEVTWQRYEPDDGFINPHRDQANYVGAIAIVTLTGQAEFEVLESRDPPVVTARWVTRSGDLVVLRGAELAGPGSRGPLHRVGPPTSERLSLTFRHDRDGLNPWSKP